MVRATARGPVKPGVAGGPIVQGNLGNRNRAGNFRNSTKTPGNFGRLAAKLAAQQNNGQ
jgi:hypothetical protein